MTEPYVRRLAEDGHLTDTEMTKRFTLIKVLACMLIPVLALSSCATQQQSPEDYVVERAQERREMLLAGELEEAYAFFSPGYRSTHSMIDFAVEERTRRISYTSAEYLSHECEESRCVVTFRLGYRVPAPVPGVSYFDGSSKVEDTWIKTRGEWWYLPEN
jgi:hypothetical protein